MTSTQPSLHTPLATLAREEVNRYLRHKLYWVGAVLSLGLEAWSIPHPSRPGGAVMDGIVPAALIGVFGLIVMNGLTRSSDRAAEAAGTVAVPERTRTLALATSVLVPFSTGLVWFVLAVVGYYVAPPEPEAIPLGVSDLYVLTVLFGLGVMSCAGGPILGLLLARWLPRRGVAAVAVVLVVLGTILMQGNFEATRAWRVVWPWTYFYGPLGWTGDHWRVLTGSPYAWVLYQAALCVLGVLVAMYHDRESDRRGLTRAIAITVVVAVVLVVLSIVGGYDQELVNPLSPAIDFGTRG
jgi:hypothetical protein